MMLGRWLTSVMDVQAAWTRPLGDAAHELLHRLFGAMPRVRDLLNGRWLGHPIHAMLTDAPIGILFLVIVLDLLGQADAARVAIVVGLLAMAGAALAGLADYADTDGRARERGTLHATLMLLALLVYLGSLALRAGQAGVPAAALGLSIAGFLILAAGAYVGGDIVYVFGNMVDRHAFRGGGSKWISLEAAETDGDGDFPEGRPIKARLGINQLVLVRQGDRVLALHDTCAHAGGPLSQGRLVDGAIECPWHFSRYRLADGTVVRGPSVYDQPAYEVRRRDGGGWEARRQPAG
jgi:nitrite reductase/ring-hydroxylating ferredoxin subunit/uncharacterized membrane protein